MKSVSEMNDAEKSVALAKLVGWIRPAGKNYVAGLWFIEVPENPIWMRQLWRLEPFKLPNFDFFNEYSVNTVWKILNWVENDSPFALEFNRWFFANGRLQGSCLWLAIDLESAVRIWLDKVLQLAEEAGLVK
jgi:hypothetical protein